MPSGRSFLFDNLKGVLMFLVVLGHVLEGYVEKSSIFYVAFGSIYLFHMPLFIFISGFFSKNVDKSRESAVERLLFPFLIWNIVYFLFDSIIHRKIHFSIITSQGAALWYLLSLFTIKILLKDIVKIKYSFIVFFLLSLVIGYSSEFNRILSLSRTICFLPYFLLGFCCTNDHIEMIRKRREMFIIFGVVMLVVSIFYWQHAYIGDNKLKVVQMLYMCDSYQLHEVSFLQGVLFRVYAFFTALSVGAGIIAIIPSGKIALISQIGENSLFVYLTHIYFMRVIQVSYKYLPHGAFVLGTAMLLLAIGLTVFLSVKKFTIWYNGLIDRLAGWIFLNKKEIAVNRHYLKQN